MNQPSLAGLELSRMGPGIEMPGYSHRSLRDEFLIFELRFLIWESGARVLFSVQHGSRTDVCFGSVNAAFR